MAGTRAIWSSNKCARLILFIFERLEVMYQSFPLFRERSCTQRYETASMNCGASSRIPRYSRVRCRASILESDVPWISIQWIVYKSSDSKTPTVTWRNRQSPNSICELGEVGMESYSSTTSCKCISLKGQKCKQALNQCHGRTWSNLLVKIKSYTEKNVLAPKKIQFKVVNNEGNKKCRQLNSCFDRLRTGTANKSFKKK